MSTLTPHEDLRPLAVNTVRVILYGIGLWVAALIITLVVPSLHEGTRHWWPWTCAAGIALGLIAAGYVRRGRGNAAIA